MNVADRIQSLRKTKGISQEQLADYLGVSRQAVSKWESEQSSPDLENIILISDYFEVTTDYLLKGIEKQECDTEEKPDARIFAATGTTFNFIGIIVAVMVWVEEQTPTATAIGFILLAMGCMIYAIGHFIGKNTASAKKWFGVINIWLLLLMPISCIFNMIDGILGGFGWLLSPIPRLGNSLVSFALCWIVYFAMCILGDVILLFYKK